MADVPVDGNPSRLTEQSFTCRVWMGCITMELGKRGILDLRKNIREPM